MQEAAPAVAQAGGRAIQPADMHVTLCFLGSVDETRIEALCTGAAGVRAAALTLTFDRIEFWGESKVLVAAAQANPPGLALANSLQRCASELGLAPDRKPWRPHLTLARSVRPKFPAAQFQADRALPGPLRLTVNRFFLAESLPGAPALRYRQLANWPLH